MGVRKQTFNYGMGLLAERYNREISAEMAALYAEQLRDLDDAEFTAAVKLAVARPGKFPSDFPSIDELRALARPAVAATVEAGEILMRILSDARCKGYSPQAGTMYLLGPIAEHYGDVAARAFLGIGGTRRVIAMSDASLPFVLKEFRECYDGYAAEQASRAAGMRIGAPVDRPRLAPGERTLRIERAGGAIDRVLPPGDRP